MVNSRAKGCRGERAWGSFLTDEGYPARRGQQYSGNPDAPDVVCPDLADMHFEVKWVQRLNIWDAMEQAKRDCGDAMPVVAHKRNHCEWLVTMRAEDWIKLVREYV